MRPAVRGIRPPSLQPNPARSYAHARVTRAIDGCTRLQLREEAPSVGVEDDGRSAVAGAMKVQTMCPDIDEPPWWPRGFTHRRSASVRSTPLRAHVDHVKAR